MNFTFRFVGIGICTLLPACASVVSDNKSTTYIETEPEIARCELHGQDFKRVVTTPASLNLPAEAAPVTIACAAKGFRTTTQKLDTEMDGWIFGNILLGGIVGIAIDAARGAGQKFPPKISVVLEPESFPSVASRDEWYGRRQAIIEQKWDSVISTLKQQCESSSSPGGCNDDAAKAADSRAKELKELDARKAGAKIRKADI